MKREIKFEFGFDSKNEIVKKVWNLLEIPNFGLLPLRYVRQFTGLKDKNGKEIFEGDVVSFEDDASGVVKWNSDYSCWTCWEDERLNDEGEVFDWSQLLKRHCKYYVVHGNIYENPELLKD
jgi:uncharacterized phage protein (TIGR01671 family)